jgi:ATPase subunit of ABC transporter with duplicated ATPase domains
MSVVLSDLSFSFPNGRVVLSVLNAAFGPGRTGLIGVNGSGKSTLLRLITGELRPASGSVTVTGEVGYLPQDLTLDTGASVASLLGIAAALDAITAIEAGDVRPELFDAVGDDWDVADRAEAWLSRLGLGHVGLGDRVGRLSGGEAMLTALAALFLRRPPVIVLDEPTNNLDLDARRRLYAAVESWPGVMLIVSHDRELLALMDQIAELTGPPDTPGGSLRMYGGNLEAYEAQLATEQAAARRAVSAAEAGVRREKRDLMANQTKQARRDRQGRRLAESGSIPKIVASARKRSAQETAGRSREIGLERVAAAESRLAEAEEAVRDDDTIRISLPGTAVPAGRTVLTVCGLDGAWLPRRPAVEADESGEVPGALDELVVRGPERVALTGPNGAGKTTLLRHVTGELDGLTVRLNGAVGYLPQRLDVLDESASVVENVRAVAPAASVNEVRAGLARFLFRGPRADQPAGTLSGGERFRAVLAALLLAQPPPQLLLLDEPTNNLDMASARQLSEALSCYQGALLVASHDVPFLRSIGISRWLRLSRDGRLREIDPSLALGAVIEPERLGQPPACFSGVRRVLEHDVLHAEFGVAAHGRREFLGRPFQVLVIDERRLLWLEVGEPQADQRRDAHRRRVAAYLAARGLDGGQRAGHRLGLTHVAGVPQVGVPRGQLDQARALGPEQQRRSLLAWTARHVLAVERLVVLPGEIDVPVPKHRHEDLHGLFETARTMIEGHTERLVLRLVPASADAQDQAPVAHLVEGGGHLRQDRRIAEGVAEHQGTDLHPLCRFRQRGQHGPALPDPCGRLTGAAVHEMVGQPDAVEAIRLRLLRELTDRAIRTLAVVLPVVHQVEHQPDLHGADANTAL